MYASNSFTWNEMKLFTKAIFWSSLWSLSFSPLCINIDHVNVHLGILNLSSIQNGESVPIMYHTRGRDPLSELDHQIVSNRRGLKWNITKKSEMWYSFHTCVFICKNLTKAVMQYHQNNKEDSWLFHVFTPKPPTPFISKFEGSVTL